MGGLFSSKKKDSQQKKETNKITEQDKAVLVRNLIRNFVLKYLVNI